MKAKKPTGKRHSGKNYKNAPILEAACDLVVQMPDKFKMADLDAFVSLLKKKFNQYEILDVINLQQVALQMNVADPNLSSSTERHGIRLKTKDGKFVIQVKKTGFTFSQIGAYEDWQKFKSAFEPLWDFFVKIIKPSKVTRVGLRYINRIDVPHAKFDLKKYFLTYPLVMGDKADISGFFMQIQIPFKDGGFALLNQSIVPPADLGKTSILLDIDVFEQNEFDPHSPNLMTLLNKLRAHKNDIFEGSITAATREMIA